MLPGAEERPAAGKRLALDLGTVRIGVAVSDEGASLAFVRPSLARRGRQRDLAAIGRLVAEERVLELVVGLPLRLDGSEGSPAAAARRFAERVERALSVPVVLWDERYSSLEAEERLREAGFDGRKVRQEVDSEAARIILQRYLDHLRGAAP